MELLCTEQEGYFWYKKEVCEKSQSFMRMVDAEIAKNVGLLVWEKIGKAGLLHFTAPRQRKEAL